VDGEAYVPCSTIRSISHELTNSPGRPVPWDLGCLVISDGDSDADAALERFFEQFHIEESDRRHFKLQVNLGESQNQLQWNRFIVETARYFKMDLAGAATEHGSRYIYDSHVRPVLHRNFKGGACFYSEFRDYAIEKFSQSLIEARRKPPLRDLVGEKIAGNGAMKNFLEPILETFLCNLDEYFASQYKYVIMGASINFYYYPEKRRLPAEIVNENDLYEKLGFRSGYSGRNRSLAGNCATAALVEQVCSLVHSLLHEMAAFAFNKESKFTFSCGPSSAPIAKKMNLREFLRAEGEIAYKEELDSGGNVMGYFRNMYDTYYSEYTKKIGGVDFAAVESLGDELITLKASYDRQCAFFFRKEADFGATGSRKFDFSPTG
jgi:hypothetical protein